MENNEEKNIINKNDFKILNNTDFTFLDLSNQHIINVNGIITLPLQLCEIILSHNSLVDVPQSIIDLKNLRKLDLSHNKIEAFNVVPNFCHVIEDLNLSNNNIHCPPSWVWTKSPKKLLKFNISNNTKLIETLKGEHLIELLQHRNQVTELLIHNCRINKHYELMGTFANAKFIQLGDSYSFYKCNALYDIPISGLLECVNLEKLYLQNTFIHNITASISIYENLIEIDLSYNKICTLPEEFCNLKNLEVCLLSFNQLLYLPDEIVKLGKLKVLSLNNNELCMLPNSWNSMKSLKCLDLYNNFICDVPEVENFDEIDVAQNYFEEPKNESYIEKQKKLRLKHEEQRYYGRKKEIVRDESDHADISDDELQYYQNEDIELSCKRSESTSSEDWEAEDWWVPHLTAKNSTAPQAPWTTFIQKKIEDGHFCPIDLHKEPINEVSQPKIFRTVSGQFDDFSDDDN